MWVYSSKTKTWTNLQEVSRIYGDNGAWTMVCTDGVKIKLTAEEYENALKYIDHNWWEKHPNGDDFNQITALKSIMKALNIKEKKDEE